LLELRILKAARYGVKAVALIMRQDAMHPDSPLVLGNATQEPPMTALRAE
jgi:hypothetical protein